MNNKKEKGGDSKNVLLPSYFHPPLLCDCTGLGLVRVDREVAWQMKSTPGTQRGKERGGEERYGKMKWG